MCGSSAATSSARRTASKTGLERERESLGVLEERAHETVGELAAELGLEADAGAFRLTRKQTAERIAVLGQPAEAGGGTAAVCGVHAPVIDACGAFGDPWRE
jgi:hypothetical protein